MPIVCCSAHRALGTHTQITHTLDISMSGNVFFFFFHYLFVNRTMWEENQNHLTFLPFQLFHQTHSLYHSFYLPLFLSIFHPHISTPTIICDALQHRLAGFNWLKMFYCEIFDCGVWNAIAYILFLVFFVSGIFSRMSPNYSVIHKAYY